MYEKLSKYRFDAFMSSDPDIMPGQDGCYGVTGWIPIEAACLTLEDAEGQSRLYNYPYVEVWNIETKQLVMVRRGDEIIRSAYV